MSKRMRKAAALGSSMSLLGRRGVTHSDLLLTQAASVAIMKPKVSFQFCCCFWWRSWWRSSSTRASAALCDAVIKNNTQYLHPSKRTYFRGVGVGGGASILNYNAFTLARSSSNRCAASSRLQSCWEPERVEASDTSLSSSSSPPAGHNRQHQRPGSESPSPAPKAGF